jgi:hypothetical protein
MHVAAHGPEEVLGLAEAHIFVLLEDAFGDQFLARVDAVVIFGNPEQRLKVTQAALALLDVGLDQIAGFALPRMALIAFGQLCLNEFRAGSPHDLMVIALHQHVEDPRIAKHEPRFKHCGAHRDVGFGHADRIVKTARGVANLEAHVP